MTLVRTARPTVTVLFAVFALWGPIVHAQEREANARLAYAQGREAYQKGKYEVALEKFRYSYTLSGEPALLYNISAALQNLDRPGDAADALQQYLTARPADPQRAELESRITQLRQSQAMVDKEAQHKQLVAQGAAGAVVFATPPPGWMSDSASDKLLADIRARERRRHQKISIGLGVGLGLVAIGGIVVGVVCGTGHCASEPKDYDFGKNVVTP